MSGGKKQYFPLFIDMAGKTVVFVGGGKVAARRIQSLLSVLEKTSAVPSKEMLQVVVVAPEVEKTVERYGEKGLLLWIKREFQPQDVDGADLVIAAADEQEINSLAAELCRRKGIPINDAGNKENCDFYFPGIAVKGDLVAAVTASGRDHARTKKAAEDVRKLFEKEGET